MGGSIFPRLGLSAKTAIGLGTFILCIIVIAGGLSYKQTRDYAEKKALEFERSKFELAVHSIEAVLANDRSNLLTLIDVPPVKAIVHASETGRAPAEIELWRTQLEMIFTAFARNHPQYLQLIYADNLGHELVKVQRNGTLIQAVPIQELLRNEPRHALDEALKLPMGGVVTSNVYLQREHDRVKEPHTAILNFASPVYSSNRSPRGAIMITASADLLFHDIVPEEGGIRRSISNERGYFLKHSEPAKTFGFELGTNYTVQSEEPDFDGYFKDQDSQARYDADDKAMDGYRKIYFDPADHSHYWLLSVFIPEAVVFAEVDEFTHKMLIVGGIIGFISVILILWFVSRKIVTPVVRLADAANQMQHGNISIRVDETSVRDEFRTLYKTINAFATNQQHSTEQLHGLIVAQKNAIRQARVASESAEASNQAKGAFLANMSHEIRTPMNAIIGLSHLCLQTELNNRQRDYIVKVNGAAKSLLGIINDILDFSKIDAGKLSTEKIPFEVEEVLGNMATIVSIRAAEKGLEFLLETALDIPPWLIGDPLRLGQILTNLAGNAVKFTEQGEVLVKVEAEEETDRVVTMRFTVQDSGIGLSQEQIDKLFQPFSQSDVSTTRKYGGTGLGLAISKQLVEMMGGRIWVESQPGQGSKFIFTARFAKAVVSDEATCTPGRELRGLKVLAVEDNPHSRQILRSYLEAFSFKVSEATGGREAVAAIQQADQEGRPFGLVILDRKMHGMDGIETAREIHSLTALSRAPKLLMIASFGQVEMRRHLEEYLVDGVSSKPFQKNSLFNAIMDIYGHTNSVSARHLNAVRHDTAQLGGAHLLLVEDNELNQQVAQELLAHLGIIVSIAENGEEAIFQAQEGEFDGILMDMQMPIMDGMEATRELRKLERLKNLPIIAMTANVMPDNIERCIKAGMNDHICKPIEPDDLREKLLKWIKPRNPAKVVLQPQSPQDIELPSSIAGLDMAAGLRRVLGNKQFYLTMLHKFAKGQRFATAAIRKALAESDPLTAERIAHTLKGLSSTIGAASLQEVAGSLEAAINERLPREEIDKQLDNVRELLESLIVQLELKLPKERIRKTVAIDETKLKMICKQFEALLRDDDSEAGDLLDENMDMLHTAFPNHYSKLEKAIRSFDFEAALSTLTDAIEQQHEGKPHE